MIWYGLIESCILLLLAHVGGVWSLMQTAAISNHLEAVRAALPESKRQPVMWFHIHKSAGSLMCDEAKHMGEKIVQPSLYCASDVFHDWYVPGDAKTQTQSSGQTCADRASMFRDEFTWNSIERQLDTGDLCFNKFIYATIIRETIDRAESQVNYEYPQNTEHILHCLDEAVKANTGETPSCLMPAMSNATRPISKRFGWLFLDNYVIRLLGGVDTMMLPPGGVNSSHLLNAISVLSQFDLVIPFDELHSEGAKAEMDGVLGWHPRESVEVRVTSHEKRFTQEERQLLRSINKFDMALYNHFLEEFKHRRS